MIPFADASAVVKLYADEDGRSAVAAHPVLVVSALTRVEVASALWRRARETGAGASGARALLDRQARDEQGWIVLGVDTALPGAAEQLGRHPLRACDAVQLATALQAREHAGVEAFLAFDARLREAAAAEGFRVLP